MVKTIKNKRNKRKSKKIIGGAAELAGAALSGFAAAGSVFGRKKQSVTPASTSTTPAPINSTKPASTEPITINSIIGYEIPGKKVIVERNSLIKVLYDINRRLNILTEYINKSIKEGENFDKKLKEVTEKPRTNNI